MKNLKYWLDGRKTLFGSLLAVLYVGAVAQGLIARSEVAEYVITIVLGVGLGDKIRKA